MAVDALRLLVGGNDALGLLCGRQGPKGPRENVDKRAKVSARVWEQTGAMTDFTKAADSVFCCANDRGVTGG